MRRFPSSRHLSRRLPTAGLIAGLATLFAAAHAASAQVTQDAPAGRPQAVIDLRTTEGVELVHGAWRYQDAKIVPVAHHAVGADLKTPGWPTPPFEIEPPAGVATFDDSHWPVIAATSLEERRANGRLSFNWYRLHVTVPDRVGAFDPTGATI